MLFLREYKPQKQHQYPHEIHAVSWGCRVDDLVSKLRDMLYKLLGVSTALLKPTIKFEVLAKIIQLN